MGMDRDPTHAGDLHRRTAVDRPRGSEDERLAPLVFIRMGRILQRVERVLGEHLSDFGLNTGLFDIVLRVAEEEGLSQRELAERLCHTPANVSILLDKLEAADLIRRERAGRTSYVHLTEKGRTAYREIAPAHEAIMAAHLAVLSPAERRVLLRLLRAVERGPPL